MFSPSMDLRRLVGDLAAFAASEAAAKATRLALVIVMARMLDAAAIGAAAAAMAAAEILKALTQNGVGQRIVAAPADEVEAVCRAAHRIFRIWCAGLFTLQAAAAWALWALGGEALAAAMLLIFAAEYLFMPGGLVQCHLAQREGKLKAVAAIGGAQVAFSNLAGAALLLVWPTPLAVAAPKALSGLIWRAAMRRLRPWRASDVRPAPLAHFTGFGAAVLGVELMSALRLHADKLVIGGLLGAEALGVWFFAVSAGLGLATSVSAAFAQVIFPRFCASRDRSGALREGLGLSLTLVPLIGLQALAVPVYAPVIFGAQWAGSADLAALLCLAAMPAVIWTAAAQWLRAQGRAAEEAARTSVVAGATLTATALAAPWGLEGAAMAYVLAAILAQGLMIWGVARPELTRGALRT